MANRISNMGQNLQNINRMKNIQVQMAQYQQQISTGVKHDRFMNYGADTLYIQRYRTELTKIDGYMYNINNAQSNIEQVMNSLDEINKQAGNVLSAISIQLPKGDEYDLKSIAAVAETTLQILQSNINSKIGERYLFSGSATDSKPYENPASGEANIQALSADWLNGTLTNDQFMASMNGLTDSQLGFSLGVQSAKGVYARIDDSLEVEYTSLANSGGIKDVMTGLIALTKLKQPDETTDMATKDDFFKLVDQVYKQIQGGVEKIRQNSADISAASVTINTMKTQHTQDKQNFLKTMENVESVDTAEAVVKFQALQTQLQASFQVTAMISQLSLANVLG